jgi:hypothetical protein
MGPLVTIPLLFVGDIGKFVEYDGNVTDFMKMLEDMEGRTGEKEEDDEEDDNRPF